MPDAASTGNRRLGQRLVRVLSSGGGAGAVIESALREVALEVGAALGVLWALDEEAGLLRHQQDWAAGPETEELRRVLHGLTFAPGIGVPGVVLERREPMWVADLAAEPLFARAEATARVGLGWVVAVPVEGLEGVTGVVEFLGPGVRAGSPEEMDDLVTAGRQLGAYVGNLRIEDRLRASEESSASIVQAALDCIVTMDAGGRVLDFNPAAEATFGYERADTIGRQLAELIIPPEYRDAHHRALATYVREGRATILGQRLELVGMRADGSTFPVELTVTRLGTREPPVFAGFIRDIGERHALEAAQAGLLQDALLARAQAEAAGERTQMAREEAEHALAQAEQARGRLAFLARAGREMADSMDWEETLRAVAGAAVPTLADWAALSIADSAGRLEVAAVAHRDPDREPLVWEHAHGGSVQAGAARAMASGVVELSEPAQADDGGLLQRIGSGPAAVVPLHTAAGSIGALTLGMGDSGRGFSDDDLDLVASFAARASPHIQNARLYTERSHIARTLQASLRPRALPDIPGVELGARFLPAGDQNEVGGDFYDIFPTGEGSWAAIVGDVSGKGAEAAAITALTRHTLRTGAMLDDDPAANVALLNRAMLTQIPERAFCTLFYARVRPDPGGGVDVQFANGGHPPPLLLRADGTIEAIETARGPLVGALADADFVSGALRLHRGDLLLMYTDGVTEIRTTEPALGERELRATLAAHPGASAGTVTAAVERRAVELQDGCPRDDIALLALRAH